MACYSTTDTVLEIAANTAHEINSVYTGWANNSEPINTGFSTNCVKMCASTTTTNNDRLTAFDPGQPG